LAAAGLFLALSAFALHGARRRRHFFVGWFWFVGTLVPVIGLVQAGDQAMADRYTYLPLVGISMAVSWGIGALPFVAARRWVGGALAVAVLIALGCATSLQLRHWQNGVTLFGHSLAVTAENPRMRGLLGLALLDQGRIDEGVDALAMSYGHTGPAERVRPLIFQRMTAAGDDKYDRGDLMTAVVFYRAALAIQPDSAPLQLRLGRTLLRQTRFEVAIEELRAALALDPNDAEAHFSIGLAYELSGRQRRAARHYREALRLRPDASAVARRLKRLRVRPDAAN
jgi:tetratricopeptide (TPR) repeat protein